MNFKILTLFFWGILLYPLEGQVARQPDDEFVKIKLGKELSKQVESLFKETPHQFKIGSVDFIWNESKSILEVSGNAIDISAGIGYSYPEQERYSLSSGFYSIDQALTSKTFLSLHNELFKQKVAPGQEGIIKRHPLRFRHDKNGISFRLDEYKSRTDKANKFLIEITVGEIVQEKKNEETIPGDMTDG
jgi:hypothetical protein